MACVYGSTIPHHSVVSHTQFVPTFEIRENFTEFVFEFQYSAAAYHIGCQVTVIFPFRGREYFFNRVYLT